MAGEKAPYRPPFDIYGALVVVTTLALIAGSVLLYKDLADNWKYGADPSAKQAVNLTYVNDNVAKAGVESAAKAAEWAKCPYVVVRKVDRDEYEMIKGAKLANDVPGYEWPAGYDPLQYPVLPDVDNIAAIPEAQRAALLAEGAPAAIAPPVAAPAAPAAPPAPTTAAAPVAPMAPGANKPK